MLHKVNRRTSIGDVVDKMWEPEARRLQKLSSDLTARLEETTKAVEGLEAKIRELESRKPEPIKQPAVHSRPSFHHSGDIGDIIYACPTIRAIGGGVLYLSPDNRHTDNTPPIRSRMTQEKSDSIGSLLKLQPYIDGVVYSETMPAWTDYDLNAMRLMFKSHEWRQKMNLAEIHLKSSGLAMDHANAAWLDVEPASESSGRVIVSRSERFHNRHFPWRSIMSKYGKALLFVGTQDEHEKFQDQFGAIEWFETRDLLSIARLIAGADLFIGNQSCPRAIAEGLKVACIVEGCPQIPNTHFERKDCVHIYHDEPLTFPTPPVKRRPKPVSAKTDVTIHRGAAFGDVILATAIASRLHEQGVAVRFSCVPEVQTALLRHPHIADVRYSDSPHVNLDGSYENHPDRKTRRIVELMAESAREQLSRIGISMSGNHNLTPTLCATEEEMSVAERRLNGYERPFVVFSPTSNAWANKTVHRDVWAKVECPGTKLWIGTGEAPNGYVDLKIRRWRDLIGVLAVSDLCVSVDTGPLHAAAGLGIPTVAIEQANSLSKRILGDQTDWSSVGKSLDCLGCAEMTCPIDAANPPCSFPEPEKISAAIASKLQTVMGNRVSAIIPVLRPNQRLLRCIEAVTDQVDEIVITLDGDANLTGFLPNNPKIVVIQNPTKHRTGCGHTMSRAMRHSTGRLLLLLNDDAYADPGSVNALRRAMTDGVAVVGALTRYQNGLIYHGGTVRIGAGFGHVDHNRPVRDASIKSRTEMEFVNLAFAMVRREAYFDIHGFDERYDCYSEDSDFCLGVRKAGWKVIYDPAATAIHDEGQSTTSAEKWALLRDGNSKLAAKWWSYFKRNQHTQLGTFA